MEPAASDVGFAPSTRARERQSAAARLSAIIERWLEAERDQLALWLPVGLGAGIAAWFLIASRDGWTAFLAGACGVALAMPVLSRGRLGRAGALFALAAAIGCALIWARAERVAAPVLARPVVAEFSARIVAVAPQPARELVRLTLTPIVAPALPPRLRVNVDEADAPAGLRVGAVVALRARLMPPPTAAVPGAYDFARVAWFQELGATGRALGPVRVTAVADGGWRGRLAGVRGDLNAHIREALPGTVGGVASALATGDQGAIAEGDAEAMRRSGLTHLLSISGLHVTAMVAATMLLTLRLLALSPRLALHAPLPLIAAGAGALAGIGYTLLAGAEVPTVRSCVAALLVLGGIALGREAITLRLVATGALIVLLLWPESLTGASFQLSFAAVTAIVALLTHPRLVALLTRRDEGWSPRIGRALLGLLVTGVAVEIALMPIALFHFHKAGFYGALANIVAIPLTTFVIMPLEVGALVLDLVGLGAPLWWLTEHAIGLILWIARTIAAAPGAVAALPSMPAGAFALMVAGGLWLALWRTSVRRAGLVPIAIGALWALSTPAPDLIVTGDGRHVGVADGLGRVALLRPRAGDYVRDLLGEGIGVDGEPIALDAVPGARCGADLCRVVLERGGLRWTLLATRSSYFVDIAAMNRACAGADIVVSDRRLPRTCRPRWLKADRALLAETGGLAIVLAKGDVRTVADGGGAHPWRDPLTVAPAYGR